MMPPLLQGPAAGRRRDRDCEPQASATGSLGAGIGFHLAGTQRQRVHPTNHDLVSRISELMLPKFML